MPLPIVPIVTAIIGSLLGGIFKKKDSGTSATSDNTTTQVTETQAPGPRTGIETAMLAPILQMMMKNMGRYQGAGMPAGAGNIMGGTGIQDILDMLMQQWPSMMEEFSGQRVNGRPARGNQNPNWTGQSRPVLGG